MEGCGRKAKVCVCVCVGRGGGDGGGGEEEVDQLRGGEGVVVVRLSPLCIY